MMSNQKVQKLNADVTSANEFVRAIEKGDLDVSFETNATESELKTSLVNMRDQMKKYSLAEKERNWVNEGLAKFVPILRSVNNEGRQQLVVAHDVRGPICRILGLVNLIEKSGFKEEDLKPSINYLLHAANELDAITRGLSVKIYAADEEDSPAIRILKSIMKRVNKFPSRCCANFLDDEFC